MTPIARKQIGFTLTELAMVLVIVGLLLGGLIVPLSAQQDLRATKTTQDKLAEAKNALLGYAAANGRLPCPAQAGSGKSAPESAGACTATLNGVAVGFLPASTLGLSPLNSTGMSLDGWDQPIRYAISTVAVGAQNDPFTAANGMRSATMASIAGGTLISICSSASGVTNAGTANATCSVANKLTDNAVVVIWSSGKNWSAGGTGADERHNPNPNTTVAQDPLFISHDIAAAGGANGEFDDLVTWIPPSILFNRMIAAGQLP